MTENNKHTDELKQSNHEKSEANEPEKSAIDKEIEAELLQYLEDRKQGKAEEKPEKKKYKTLMFIAPLVIAAIYIYKYIGHLF
ncbi:hypothetical protein NQ035_12390 [Staphylococcus gallinarum]|uniref:hypothetical protein n=1 Tax=Staphylococcus gallinarum TaxID=1293 RepID=UPI000D1C9029|nr:hypothetical protein [Staphylococcus gallinarum]MCD8826648.1 hypothetical protein [Staphylococcus gallinarum]MCD8899785.1 hypothetical protein [Staphylococcus gallinarum]MCQ9289675.1 hypothetical protein [Staphylococcus gallinarum]MEB6242846.1 hypothetical protein [Staphylococcus gallinarum]MEB6296950.1 hypothetical protein [Staphylococcus gallinarum]